MAPTSNSHRPLQAKRILITGGTGSLGRTLVRRLLGGTMGQPERIIVFSRDEAKQHDMRVAYRNRSERGENVIFEHFDDVVQFRVGDVRDFASVVSVMRDVHIVFNAAALKQVPSCEYFPFEAIRTNVIGAENIVRAVRESSKPPETVVGVSTDKACSPVNVMGMTKALQERIILSGALTCPSTRFVCVRYGNVLASRGSVIPLFLGQIRAGGPVTVTNEDMTRFLLSLDEAVDLIFTAVTGAKNGETYVPRVRSARVIDIAKVLVGQQSIPIEIVGIRPGEKVHEVMISEEEIHRATARGPHYVIHSILPEIAGDVRGRALAEPFSSASSLISADELRAYLVANELLEVETPAELLR